MYTHEHCIVHTSHTAACIVKMQEWCVEVGRRVGVHGMHVFAARTCTLSLGIYCFCIYDPYVLHTPYWCI